MEMGIKLKCQICEKTKDDISKGWKVITCTQHDGSIDRYLVCPSCYQRVDTEILPNVKRGKKIKK